MKLGSTFRTSTSLPGEPMLAVRLDSDGGRYALTLEGRLDARSAIGLQTEIDQLVGMRFDEVVIDVTAVEAVDRVGLEMLDDLCRFVAGRGGEVRVVSGAENAPSDGSLADAERALDDMRRAARARRAVRRVGALGRSAPGTRQTGPRPFTPGLLLGD